MLNETLKKLNFTDKEIEVYLAILQQGKISPTDLAKITNINRTTVYSVVKELVKKGVINEDLGGKSLYLIAKPPQDMKQIVKKEEKKLAEKSLLIDRAIDELKKVASATKYSIPKIVFIAEDDLENYLYKQTPIWNESILKYDGVWWGFQDYNFVKSYERWIDWYWESGSPKEMNLKLLSNKVAEEIKEKKFPRRKIKFWSKSKDFTSTVWILGDYLVMIVTSQRPYYLVEIHDSTLAHNMREVFKGIWNELK